MYSIVSSYMYSMVSLVIRLDAPVFPLVSSECPKIVGDQRSTKGGAWTTSCLSQGRWVFTSKELTLGFSSYRIA